MKLRSGRVVTKRKTSPRRSVKSVKSVKKIVRKELNKATTTFVRGDTRDLPNINNQNIQTIRVLGANINQGDEQGQRHGSKIKLTGYKFNLHIRNLTADKDGWVRIICVRRKEPNAGFAGLFQSNDEGVDGNAFAAGDNNFIMRPINKALYSVKFDRRVRLLGENDAAVGRHDQYKKYTIPFKTHLKYDKVAQDNESINPNYVVMVFIAWKDNDATRTLPMYIEDWTYFKNM